MAHPHPSGYPWIEEVRIGWLHHDRFVEEELPDALDDRVPVVAVGSNAAPTVLRHKFGKLLESGLPVSSALVEGLHIGHSAHVSVPGFVAAAPARVTTRQPRPVTVSWFDPDQLAALDATEPQYRRIPLPPDMTCQLGEDGPIVQGAQVYESLHGVLGEAGRPLELLPQHEVLAWLAQRLPPDLTEEMVHERLTNRDLRDRVKAALVAADLVLPSGLDATHS